MFLHKDYMPYVVALYQQAVEEKQLQSILMTTEGMCKVMYKSPEVLEFLKIPFIPFEEKLLVLEHLWSNKIPPLLMNFFRVLGGNRKLGCLYKILKKFLEYADHKMGIHHVHVISAYALDEVTKTTLRQALKDQLGTDIKLVVQVDHSLIGGIVIYYHHHKLDLSLRHRIFSLKSILQEVYS